MKTGAAVGLILLALVPVWTGCPKRALFKGPDTAMAALDSALATLEAGRYRQAEDALNWVIFNFPGSREAADAQYWLADSYFRQRDYTRAQTEYEFYLQSFPYARYREEAQYRLGLSWLRSAPAGTRDQSPMQKAKEILSDFLLLYPESELKPEVEAALAEIERRRTRRDFDTARLYYRGGAHRSALVYYRHIAESMPPEQWDPEDRLRFADCFLETDEPDQALPLLYALLDDESVPSEIREQARRRLDRLR